jgi:transposase
MLGTEDPQRGMFEAASQLDDDEIEEMGLYGQMARYGSELFEDEDFAHMYDTENGRPSTPPSLLARARLLQHYEDISEREVIRRCKYDLRWKVALGLDLQTTEKPFARTTFQAFRYRLTLHDEDGMVFEKSIERAREVDLLDEELEVALDSSPVRGQGAVEDTYQEISSQIGSVLRAVADSEGCDVEALAEDHGVARHIKEDSIKGSELVDWSDDEDVDRFLAGLLEDTCRVVKLARRKEAGQSEVALLERIIDEDVDLDPDDGDGPTIAQGTARERIVSTSDPEMRHGRKSSTGTYDGHKAHIGVDVGSDIIVDVEVTAPSEAEGEHIEDSVERIEARTACEVGVALGDSAYGTREGRRQADKADIELRTKMPSPNASWQLGADDFEVSDDGREVTCPEGHTSTRSHKKGDGIQHYFAESDCADCPLKDKCTNADRRTFFVAGDFHEKKRRRQWAKTPEGRRTLRRRVGVEHAIGRLKQWGAGQARYAGRAKTKGQWAWTAAIANLSIIWDHRDATDDGPTPALFAEMPRQNRGSAAAAPLWADGDLQSSFGAQATNIYSPQPRSVSPATNTATAVMTPGLRPAL